MRAVLFVVGQFLPGCRSKVLLRGGDSSDWRPSSAGIVILPGAGGVPGAHRFDHVLSAFLDEEDCTPVQAYNVKYKTTVVTGQNLLQFHRLIRDGQPLFLRRQSRHHGVIQLGLTLRSPGDGRAGLDDAVRYDTRISTTKPEGRRTQRLPHGMKPAEKFGR